MHEPAARPSGYLADDHQRLEALLDRATATLGTIDAAAFAEFRRGLLRHIAMEEKILIPAAQRVAGAEISPAATRLRLDHGALAALLVPTPTPGTVHALREILASHNAVEEGPAGFYAICERLIGDGAPTVLAALRAAPEVPVAAHNDGPLVMPATCRALARAGYDPALVDAQGR